MDSFYFANAQQKRDLQKLTDEFGEEASIGAVKWAASKGINDTQRIISAADTFRRRLAWGKDSVLPRLGQLSPAEAGRQLAEEGKKDA